MEDEYRYVIQVYGNDNNLIYHGVNEQDMCRSIIEKHREGYIEWSSECFRTAPRTYVVVKKFFPLEDQDWKQETKDEFNTLIAMNVMKSLGEK